jgi:hypothetical protein
MVPSTVLGHLRVEKDLCPIQEPNHDYLDVQPLDVIIRTELCLILFLLALQPPSGFVFYSPLAGFSLLAYEVS